MADDARSSLPIERPAVAEVLACLTHTDEDPAMWVEFWRNATDATAVRVDATDAGAAVSFLVRALTVPWIGPVEWTVDTPREAFERLTLRDVLPMSWADDSTRTFDVSASVELNPSLAETPVRCRDGFEVVVTTGLASSDLAQKGTITLRRGDRRLTAKIRLADEPERVFREMLTRWPEPASMPDLLAWASLGAETIVAAEELAREAVRRLRPFGIAARNRRCVWKVGAVPLLRRGGLAVPQGWPTGAGAPTPQEHDPWAWAKHSGTLIAAGVPEHLALRTTHVDLWPVADPNPCPFAPELELLRMGLALDAITDDALVVVVPPLGDSNE